MVPDLLNAAAATSASYYQVHQLYALKLRASGDLVIRLLPRTCSPSKRRCGVLHPETHGNELEKIK